MERSSLPPRLPLFGGIAIAVLVADQITKIIAVDALAPVYVPREVIGNAVRFTLVYNPGAAFGISFGTYSREIFTVLTIGALVLLYRLYKETSAGDLKRIVAISLVTGGAIGNLLDRLRNARGVVDFVDVGIGFKRWPTFNVADMAISCGAILLAIVLWREDTRHAAQPAETTPTRGPDSPADAPLQG